MPVFGSQQKCTQCKCVFMYCAQELDYAWQSSPTLAAGIWTNGTVNFSSGMNKGNNKGRQQAYKDKQESTTVATT